MFAVLRTGGKQYRVAAGDKIAVEKLAGEAGDKITLGDVLLAGDGGAVKDAAGVVVSAEIIAQAKSEKVIVFKKRRRHNYRRKNGHRQQMTLLRIVSVGAEDKKSKKEAAPKEAKVEKAETPAVAEKPAKAAPKKVVGKTATYFESAGDMVDEMKKGAAKKAPAKKAAKPADAVSE